MNYAESNIFSNFICMEFSHEFVVAIRDYYDLLNKKYPQKTRPFALFRAPFQLHLDRRVILVYYKTRII